MRYVVRIALLLVSSCTACSDDAPAEGAQDAGATTGGAAAGGREEAGAAAAGGSDPTAGGDAGSGDAAAGRAGTDGSAAARPEDDAELVSAELPSALACGASFEATVVMRNAGTRTWTRAGGYKLGAVDDSDPFSAEGRVLLAELDAVSPGATHTFVFPLVAPDMPGEHATDWRMVRENVTWFGATAASSAAVACARESFELVDPLANGTLGNAVGGSFGPAGWTVTAATDRLWYALPRLVEGSIEFTVTNMTIENLLVADNEIFALYEAGHGIAEPIRYNPEYRENHYKGMLRIYGQAEPERVGQQKLIWGLCPAGAPGYGPCSCASFLEEPFGGDGAWDGSAQRLRIEWGGGRSRYLRNGVEIVSIDWSQSGLEFGPSQLHFSLGTSRSTEVATAAMPIGAVFSELTVEGIEGPEVSACP